MLRLSTVLVTLVLSLPLIAQKQNIEIEKLDILNSPYREVNLSITPNGRYLYYMSSRGQMPWSTPDYVIFKGQSEYDGDIWYSEYKDSAWQTPTCLSNTINTPSGEDEPNISTDAQKVYFQSWERGWERNGGPYYQAILDGEKWRSPRGMGSGINQFFRDYHYATDGMSISSDGKIFLVAAGPIYNGNMDVFISRKNNKGQWSYPKILDISTKGDERNIFIAGDNRTLYFASDAYGGKGGMDILKTTLNDDNSTGKVINIGKPINTKEDDYGFIIGVHGNDCFFVRENDIYYADLSNVDEDIKPLPTIIFEGILVEDGKPVPALIDIISPDTTQLITSSISNGKTGIYSFTLPNQEGHYLQRIRTEKTDTIFPLPIPNNSINIIEQKFSFTPPTLPEPEEEIVAKTPTPATAPTPSAPEIIEQELNEMIYFDFDQSVMKASELAKIKELYKVLNKAQSAEITITGHTDAIGSDAYNQELAQKRANNIAHFFVLYNTQVDAMGEHSPIMDNDSPEHRALNRRVEIVVKLRKVVE